MKIRLFILVAVGWVASSLISCKPEVDTNNSRPHKETEDSILLNTVQNASMNYMWTGADPVSGMAYERIHLDNDYGSNDPKVITTGGTGFGIAGLVVAMERGFIPRESGVERLQRIVDFLAKADRFHGIWPHWLHSDGKVVPFSQNDNGGDLVESSFLMEGLLIARQYLNASQPTEKTVIDAINNLYQSMEFDWYKNKQNCLYWHWSPDKGWVMNMPIRGWNEALIVYVLAASSPTHSISKTVYTEGWGKTNHPTSTYNEPLFWTHYSFIGLNPMTLKDQYASYKEVVVGHALAQHDYCVRNPKRYPNYGSKCWGLTAGYSPSGYSAHSINNDLGVITITAALSSMPYTPTQSLEALRYFNSRRGELWGTYGFYDGFCDNHHWCLPRYLAIDQLTIAPMIENYRSGLLWKLFMSCPEIQTGLTKLGFTY
ncbi:MAG: beta-glucosidase [Paludibacteraceae bacterium]|nr:beta-glucosidase [Paludibacteraceae bacterium]